MDLTIYAKGHDGADGRVKGSERSLITCGNARRPKRQITWGKAAKTDERREAGYRPGLKKQTLDHSKSTRD